MKTRPGVTALMGSVLLASYAFRPDAILVAAEKSEQLVVQAQTGAPTMTPGKGLDVITGPNLPVYKRMYEAIIKAGTAESQHGRRVHGRLIFDLSQADLVTLSVPYGEPAVELSGAITYPLKPGEKIYVQPRWPLGQEVFIEINGRQTDTILFNTK